MPRKLRFMPVGIPQHVIQRGNNRQVCFATEEDFKAYLYWLKKYSCKYSVEIHAWVLMTNHVHILCTPKIESGISKMMQDLGRSYVRYFNYTYKRSGTLWEGRFKSCLVNADEYLLHLHRYIELNPVRACMVDDPADYCWSSYRGNALGVLSHLLTKHSIYLGLGVDGFTRQEAYRAMFRSEVSADLLIDIRKAANKGLVLGNDKFVTQVEKLRSSVD
ncbi:transposase [Neptuniibacter sp. QD34_54]|uniref:transposase n=1 Tax=Neptuniibacter sp. QD34_54 TaxID=3398208 RepID=UPI0039F5C30C